MNDESPITAYLDQSVLGFIRDEQLHLDRLNNVDWIYSDEHFHEILRGRDRSFLTALKKLQARRLEPLLDANSQFTGQAHTHPYIDPDVAFESFKKSMGAVAFDPAPILDLLARFNGADNFEDAASVPGKLEKQLNNLLSNYPILSRVRDDVVSATKQLEEFIGQNLQQVSSLEEMRGQLGLSKGRAGSVSGDDPIQAIEVLIREKYPEISMDEIIEFSSSGITTNGGAVQSRYQRIIVAHLLLNFLGYRPDQGMANSRKLQNILSDGVHIANAAFCQVLISADRKLCEKAEAIYKHQEIRTHVLWVEETE